MPSSSSQSNPSGALSYLFGARYIATSGEWSNSGDTIADGTDASFNGVSAVADDEGGAHALFIRYNTTTLKYDVADTHFSKAEGFSAATAIDSLDPGPASVPRLSTNGTARLASWSQFASSTENAYSALSDGEDYAGQDLRSDGDYSVEYGDVVSGLDRRGNGLVLFAQENADMNVDILFSRLAGGTWADAVKINQNRRALVSGRASQWLRTEWRWRSGRSASVSRRSRSWSRCSSDDALARATNEWRGRLAVFFQANAPHVSRTTARAARHGEAAAFLREVVAVLADRVRGAPFADIARAAGARIAGLALAHLGVRDARSGLRRGLQGARLRAEERLRQGSQVRRPRTRARPPA